MKTLPWMFVFLLMIAGCASSGPVFNGFEGPSSQQLARVYVYRPNLFFNGGSNFVILINDEEKFVLKNGGYNFADLPPGDYVAKAKPTVGWKSFGPELNPTTIHTGPGESYFIRFDLILEDMEVGPFPGAVYIKGRSNFVQVDRVLAQSEMIGLRLSK